MPSIHLIVLYMPYRVIYEVNLIAKNPRCCSFRATTGIFLLIYFFLFSQSDQSVIMLRLQK